jgi:voltage-gated potassium channel
LLHRLKQRTYEIVEPARPADAASRIFDLFIEALIVLNVFAVMLETVGSFAARYGRALHGFEVFSIMVFTVEYVLRLWSCTVDPRYSHPVKGRLALARTPMLLIDLLAILPFFLPMVLPLDLRVARTLRLFRLLRLAKLARYSRALRTLGRVLYAKKEDLLVSAFVLVVLMIVVASMMYYFEHEAQPHQFSSIPATMWWAVITLTTVGYGDMYPVTVAGRILGAIIAVLGVGMVALPAGLLASGFAEELRQQHAPMVCPHCGKPIQREP